MITILLVIIGLVLLPAALEVAAAVMPGLLKVAFVVGGIVGLLWLLSAVFDALPDAIWAWAVLVVLVLIGALAVFAALTPTTPKRKPGQG